jgi:hypothetical protein
MDMDAGSYGGNSACSFFVSPPHRSLHSLHNFIYCYHLTIRFDSIMKIHTKRVFHFFFPIFRRVDDDNVMCTQFIILFVRKLLFRFRQKVVLYILILYTCYATYKGRDFPVDDFCCFLRIVAL